MRVSELADGEDTRARLTGDVLKKAKDYRRDEVKG